MPEDVEPGGSAAEPAAPSGEAPSAPTGEEPTGEPTAEAPTGEEPTPEAPVAEAPTAEAPTAEAPTAEAPTAEAPTAEAPAEPAPAAAASPEEARTLARQALNSLNRSRNDEARDLAQRAVAADPANSMGWLVLGAARGELGDREGSRAAYQSCVDQGSGPQVRECRAMLRTLH